MNNNGSSTTGIMIGILVIVVIAIVAWIAYAQGYFGGAKQQAQPADSGSVQLNVGGSANGASGY